VHEEARPARAAGPNAVDTVDAVTVDTVDTVTPSVGVGGTVEPPSASHAGRPKELRRP
jgi:hypothetical protein